MLQAGYFWLPCNLKCNMKTNDIKVFTEVFSADMCEYISTRRKMVYHRAVDVFKLVGMHLQGTGWKSNEPNLIFNLLIIEHIVYINLQNVFKQHAMKIFVLFYFSRSSSFGIITFWLPHVYSVSLQMHFANHLSDMYARVSILRKCGLFQKKTEKTLRGSVYAFRIWSIRPWLQAQWRHTADRQSLFPLAWNEVEVKLSTSAAFTYNLQWCSCLRLSSLSLSISVYFPRLAVSSYCPLTVCFCNANLTCSKVISVLYRGGRLAQDQLATCSQSMHIIDDLI